MRYVLVRRLGVGGMAEVFEARLHGAQGFRRTVAVKRILGGLAANPRYAAMFHDEACLAARLSHPNIISVIGLDGDENGAPLLVMEYVAGVELAALARVPNVPPSVAIFIATEILSGLAYMHDLRGEGGVRGVVHRDLSPHNVLLSWEGAVKIADFGIAKVKRGRVAPGSALLRGTAGYMSPEQVNGEDLDGRSDLFALGVILWEFMTGRRLFAGTAREVAARVLVQPIERPSVHRDVPRDLERVVMRMLQRTPSARHDSAADALDELVSCQDAPRNGRRELARFLEDCFPDAVETRVQAHRSSRVQRDSEGTKTAPSLSTASAPPVQAMADAGRARKRLRWRWFAAIVVLAVLLCLRAWSS